MPATIIVEDGSGKADANSYLTASAVVDYLEAQGILTGFVALADANRPGVLLRAMRWLESEYRNRWKGTRADIDQALAWPRVGVQDQDGYTIDADVVPQAVKDAVCLAAERESAGVGTLDPDQERGGMVTQETIGPLSVSYAKGAPAGTTFPAITNLLTGLTRGGVTASVRRT